MDKCVHNLFYIPPSDIKGQELVVKGDTFHHLIHVLRCGLHDHVVCTDGKGDRLTVEIMNITRGKAQARIVSKEHVDQSMTVELDLAFVPIKGTRNEMVLEKGTEVGVSNFRIFQSRFSVVRAPGKAKRCRFEKIVRSAMLQSMRYRLPGLLYHGNITDLINCFADYDQVVVADQGSDREIPCRAHRILLIVGPEGGFSEDEKASMAKAGACLLGVGIHRLRSETAAIAGVVKILSAYRQL